jgi:TPR repeat protein
MYKIIGLALLVFCTSVGAQTLSIESQKSIETLKAELNTEFAKVIAQAKEQNIPLSALRGTSSHKVDRAYLGVIFEPCPDGLQILSIRPNSAAAMSNLTAGMVITHINGLSVTSQNNKTIVSLLNGLMSIDTLIVKVKNLVTPLTVGLDRGLRYTPAFQLQLTSEETAPAQGGNTPEAMREISRRASALTRTVTSKIRQGINEVAGIEISAGNTMDRIKFSIEGNSNHKLSYKLIVGESKSSYKPPQFASFNDGRLPELQSCNTKQCRQTYSRYSRLRSENTGFLNRLRNAQFTAAGYGTQQKISMAAMHFRSISYYSDLPYVNFMRGKLLLEHKNEPISASVFLRRAVQGEQPDPEALQLLSSIYSNPEYDVIMPSEAQRYQELARIYPVPEFNMTAEEFMARELAQFTEHKRSFEDRYRPRNEVVKLNGAEGVYPYLILKDLANCQTDKCQEHFTSYLILDENKTSSNQAAIHMRLGEMYKAGYGVEPNLVKAMSYFKHAANSNIPYAQYEFANIALRLKQQIEYANSMLDRAAEAGYRLAMISLSSRYKSGRGREKDLEKASYWDQQFKASYKAKNTAELLNDETDLSSNIIKQLESYNINLDNFLEVESKVLSNALHYSNGKVFELPLNFGEKSQ